MRIIQISLVVALLSIAAPRAQSREPSPQERPQFRTGVELVQLDVSVLDRDRRPVTGLTADDFTLFENGRRRPIRTFTPIQVAGRSQAAATAQTGAAPPPDVANNRIGAQDGRLVVILMDRTIPAGEPTVTARRVATAVVDALGPNDVAALVSTSGGVPQNLTSDPTRLIAAIEQRDWSTGPSREQDAILASQPLIGPDDPLSDGRCLCGLCVLQTVTRVANAVQHAPRRHKTLLFIGSSLIAQSAPRGMRLDTGCERPLEDARKAMEASLDLSHLTVHSIDPSGLATVGAHTQASTPNKPPRGGRLVQLQDDTGKMLAAHGSLDYLPELTGGRRVINTNGPDEKVPAIFEESSAYYLLAFESELPPGSTKTSSIEVKVSRPGVSVFTQRNYQIRSSEPTGAKKARTPEVSPLLAAVHGLFPVATRPLTVAAAAFPGSATKAMVVVNIDVGAFGREAASVPLDFALSAVDQTGREIGSSTKSTTVAFRSGTGSEPVETNVQTSIELPPGDYEIRMAVADPQTGTVASVFAPLRVPRFADEPLTLSDAVIEASGGAAVAPPGQTVLSPTTRRTFGRNEYVRAVMQIAQGIGRADLLVPIAVRTRILDANGQTVRDKTRTVAEKDFGNRIARVTTEMNDLPAGSYVLSVDAASRERTVSRALPFSIR